MIRISRKQSRGVLSWLGWSLWALWMGLGAAQCATSAGDSGGSGGWSSSSSGGSAGNSTDATIIVSDSGTSYGSDDGGQVGLQGSGSSVGSLDITPANPVIDVTIVDGKTTIDGTVTFTASAQGSSVSPVWSLNRGDLGSIDPSSGTFTANGNLSGSATVTASFGAHVGSTTVAVRITVTNHGGAAANDAGPAGYGGVGGEGPGGPANEGLFSGTVVAPKSASDLSFVYPYDQTVWPRGLLAPLLQWTTTHTANAVYIHLSQTNYEFKGYYAISQALVGPQTMRQPIDQSVWDQATHGNQGDKLHAEVTIAGADGVIGPIAENWIISPSVLQGTVYYGSYGTTLNGDAGSSGTGAVLSILPGATSPTLAIPSLQGTCHVCHEVSANGSTVFTDDIAYAPNDNTAEGYGSSYDLAKGAALIKAYDPSAETAGIQIQDIIGKFTYSGVYPDGTFALANSGDNLHAYSQPSNIFSRDTLLPIASTGFTDIVNQAITPAFSPDGRHVAFSFGQAQSGSDASVTAGGGHSLAAMDFDCGAPAGSVACGSPPFSFANIREIHRDPARYLGWPSFSPDGNSVVFQSTISPSTNGSVLNTWAGGTAEIMIADARPAPQFTPQRLCALNGYASDCATPYLPVVPKHPNDTIYNYEPTMNPIASGGYYWVVFTSRRAYGNIAQADPYDSNGYVGYPVTKKLWVAAIDENPTPGVDPSHPAFYLPGQELNAGDMRGYWVVEPCRADGVSCTTGDQCCDGFCRSPPDGGGLVCMTSAPGCANEFEKCITAADCCAAGTGEECLNGYCTMPSSTRIR